MRNRKLRIVGGLLCSALFGAAIVAFMPNPHAQDRGRVVRAQDVVFQEVAPFVSMGAAWGDRGTGPHGTFGVFPGGASSPPHTHSGAYHAVVVSGVMTNPFGDEADPPEMSAGSYWYVPAGAPHVTACVSPQPCVFYFHADGAFDFAPAP